MKEKTYSILIIDDNPADQNLLKRYIRKLEEWNIDVKSVNSSEEGLSIYKTYKPDIIIIDYLLGNETGIDVINKFKNIACKAEYVLLTGYGSETVVTDALRAGASDYLNKGDLSVQMIRKTIRHVARKIASDEIIKKTESKLSYILDKTSTGLATFDINGQLINANKSYLSMVGTNTIDNLFGKYMYQWAAASCKDDIINAIEKCKLQGFVSDFETIYVQPNGEQTYVLINALLEKDNKEDKIFAICRDITELKLYEHRLKQEKIKAEEADKLKSSFLANMSHEIRTPMNAIIGFADLLEQDNISDSERNEYLGIIKRSGTNLLVLIDDIIDLSKIEVEKIEIVKQKFDVNKVLQTILITSLKKKPTCIEINFENNKNNIEELIVNSDPFRFKQVLNNLINNALKFTEAGTISFGYKIENNNILTFYVKDTGIGISTDKQEIIFDRFRKIEDSNAKLYRGTGLGLTISKKLIELLNGKIWVNSELGKGSTFYFTLPFKNENKIISRKQNKMTKKSIKAIWENNLVLIVEDEDLNYLYLEKLLKFTKIKIVRAKTGIEAVEYIKNNKNTDIILMDIKLPEMDGVTATKEIRKISSEIPIIAQTAFAMKGDKDEFIEAGCNDYISKPINAEKLIELMSKLIKEDF